MKYASLFGMPLSSDLVADDYLCISSRADSEFLLAGRDRCQIVIGFWMTNAPVPTVRSGVVLVSFSGLLVLILFRTPSFCCSFIAALKKMNQMGFQANALPHAAFGRLR